MPLRRGAADDLAGPVSKQPKDSNDHRPPISRNRDDYTIGVVCALPHEADAVLTALDAKLPRRDTLETVDGDNNTYSFGLIGDCHVVVVHLGGIGPVEAAHAAESMSRSFRQIHLCLVVGICGIVPTISRSGEEMETLLGDVVISTRIKQYTMGHRYPNGFKMRETLGRPGRKLRSLFEFLKTMSGLDELRKALQEYLSQMLKREDMTLFQHPGYSLDHLYQSSYEHKHTHESCIICARQDICKLATKTNCAKLGCDLNKLVRRERINRIQAIEAQLITARDEHLRQLEADFYTLSIPEVFLEVMASGDEVMKSGRDRDRIAEEEDVVAIEMEGAGVWDVFPTVVIKSACNYADSHENKIWQKYAATTAAACAKAFVEFAKLPLHATQDHPSIKGCTFHIPEGGNQAGTLEAKTQLVDFHFGRC